MENDFQTFGLLTVAAGLLAYMYENREPVAVKKETLENIFNVIQETGRIPQFAIDERDGYFIFGALMSEKTVDDIVEEKDED